MSLQSHLFECLPDEVVSIWKKVDCPETAYRAASTRTRNILLMNAAQKGYLDVIQFADSVIPLTPNQLLDSRTCEIVDLAGWKGHTPILEWVQTVCHPLERKVWADNQWLLIRYWLTQNCPVSALQWLHEKFQLTPEEVFVVGNHPSTSMSIFHFSIMVKHVAAVGWFCEQFQVRKHDPSPVRTYNYLVQSPDDDIAELLRRHLSFRVEWVTSLYSHLSKRDSLCGVLRRDSFLDLTPDLSETLASLFNTTKVKSFIYKKLTRLPSDSLVDALQTAIKTGKHDAIHWLHKYTDVYRTRDMQCVALDCALRYASTDTISFVITFFCEGLDLKVALPYLHQVLHRGETWKPLEKFLLGEQDASQLEDVFRRHSGVAAKMHFFKLAPASHMRDVLLRHLNLDPLNEAHSGALVDLLSIGDTHSFPKDWYWFPSALTPDQACTILKELYSQEHASLISWWGELFTVPDSKLLSAFCWCAAACVLRRAAYLELCTLLTEPVVDAAFSSCVKNGLGWQLVLLHQQRKQDIHITLACDETVQTSFDMFCMEGFLDAARIVAEHSMVEPRGVVSLAPKEGATDFILTRFPQADRELLLKLLEVNIQADRSDEAQRCYQHLQPTAEEMATLLFEATLDPPTWLKDAAVTTQLQNLKYENASPLIRLSMDLQSRRCKVSSLQTLQELATMVDSWVQQPAGPCRDLCETVLVSYFRSRNVCE
jgi:hypothetical protein